MFMPATREDMQAAGWDQLDVILVTGDAYIDHPSFGAAIIGKYLISNGFRTGVISQPDINSNKDFNKLPRPLLFIGITSGNADSMVNNYTSSKKPRKSDNYSEGGLNRKRPDRAAIVYANKIRENFKNIPVILGGIEASLRRVAHYDYWSDRIRRSIIFDSKADLIVFGAGERTILTIAKKLSSGKSINRIRDLRGTAFVADRSEKPPARYFYKELKSFESISLSKEEFFESEKILHSVTNPYFGTGLLQKTNGRILVVNPPLFPDEKIDEFYDLDFEKKPHPDYMKPIPAFDMIRNSITIHRGCFGGCTFCSISQHQGKFTSSRSERSILTEIRQLSSKSVTDLGGPSANMYRMKGLDLEKCKKCSRLSCLFPEVCRNLDTSHKHLLELYKNVKEHKRVFINSGIRHELALLDKNYIKALAEEYTSGILKIAPEHTEKEILKLMLKPEISKYEEFISLFRLYSKKKQYVIPYLISAFPGVTTEKAQEMSDYLRINKIKVEQVQDFIPLPMTIAACMYYTERDYFTGEKIYVAKTYRERQHQKNMMQWWKK